LNSPRVASPDVARRARSAHFSAAQSGWAAVSTCECWRQNCAR
jgi:hypothetical protein